MSLANSRCPYRRTAAVAPKMNRRNGFNVWRGASKRRKMPTTWRARNATG
jgi:hypothetical protein